MSETIYWVSMEFKQGFGCSQCATTIDEAYKLIEAIPDLISWKIEQVVTTFIAEKKS